MSQRLLDHSPDLQKLIQEGYELEIRGGYALIHHIPYVTASQNINYGTLVCSLTLRGEATTKPETHVISFIGEMPCDKNGNKMTCIEHGHGNQNLGNGIIVQHSFSNKPDDGYPNYYEKFKRYAEIISAPAISLDSSVRVKTFKSWDTDCKNVFKYKDTNSSKAGIGAVSDKLIGQRIGIIGLGGTGSYILDFLAKTPIDEIHLFDGDIFMQHNAFRAPGAASEEDLSKCEYKATYLSRVYSNMHSEIIPHSYFLTEEHMDELDSMTFVFVSMDCTLEKREIINYLLEKNIPFIDTGIGLNCVDEKIGGLVRATTVLPETPEAREVVRKYIPLDADPEEDLYKTNIQIAELNALNAIMAVVNYKKYIGFYQDQRNNHLSVYTIDIGEIMNANNDIEA